MKKLRELGIKVGHLEPGAFDAITDIDGVGVGHVDIGEADLNTGLSVVSPYPPAIKERALFVGRWSLDDGGAASGLGVAEDFGTFSSPIALAPAPVFGRVYEAMIQQGVQRDSGLSTNAGWPPIVLGLDDGAWNDARRVYDSVREQHLDRALAAAVGGAVAEGNVGIGRALRAFGIRGGVGTASRLAGRYTVGIFVAVNGGVPASLYIDGQSLQGEGMAELSGPQEFVAVVATDAPLVPLQLRALAQRGALGAARCRLWNAHTRTGQVVAFSSVESEKSTVNEVLRERPYVGKQALYTLFAAACEAMEAAVLSAMLSAQPLQVGERELGVLRAELVQKLKGN
jgi:D-aminopeptidase